MTGAVLVLVCSADLTGGGASPVGTGVVAPSNVVVSPQASKRVLWDRTHGQYLQYYIPNGKYTTLEGILGADGFTLDTTTLGIDNINLTPYGILVLNLGSNWNTAYTASERVAVQNFWQNGGSVLVMSENPACPNGNLNQIFSLFGITWLGASASYFDVFTANPVYTGLFAGIAQLYVIAPGSITMSAPGEEVAWAVTTPLIVARCDSGRGGVVDVGDINILDNSYIANADNRAFALTLFRWLAAPPCAPVYMGTDEGKPSPRLRLTVGGLERGAVSGAYEAPDGGTLTLVDATGRTLETRAVEGSGSLRLSASPGVYFVTLTSDGKTLSRRAVVC